jgi:hypothetical protein
VSMCTKLQSGEIILRDAKQEVITLMHFTGIHFGLFRVCRGTVDTGSVQSN